MNRRDFLHPRQIALGAGQILGAVEEWNAAPSDPSSQTALVRMAGKAMATRFEVVLPFGTPNTAELGGAAFDLIDELEAQLTVYRDTSEVSRLNRLAPYRPVPVEGRLFELLNLASTITAQTEGAFDITAGALTKAWGFFRGPRHVPGDREREVALARVGMQHVLLSAESKSVRYLRPGLELNLGAIGKGYTLDRVAEMLRDEWKISTGLLHGGYSSVYAMGCPPGERGWSIGVRHPWDPQRRLALVWLRDRALGTSAATFQYLEHNGKKLGHVLDPRSGWPASGVASATVLAPTAALADALSTAFFVAGIDAARRYCDCHPEIGAFLLPEDESDEPVTLGLRPDDIAFEIQS
jgi:thiamine biosynthesis lipoprotein